MPIESTLQSLTYQSSNFSSWINGTSTNFTLVCFILSCRKININVVQPPADTSVAPLIDALLPSMEPLDPQIWSYYHNLTGFLRSQATFYNLSNTVPPYWAPRAKSFFDIANVNETQLIADIGEWKWQNTENLTITILDHASVRTDVVVIHVSKTVKQGMFELKFPVGLHRSKELCRKRLPSVHSRRHSLPFEWHYLRHGRTKRVQCNVAHLYN
jgi:hypothetical protein